MLMLRKTSHWGTDRIPVKLPHSPTPRALPSGTCDQVLLFFCVLLFFLFFLKLGNSFIWAVYFNWAGGGPPIPPTCWTHGETEFASMCKNVCKNKSSLLLHTGLGLLVGFCDLGVTQAQILDPPESASSEYSSHVLRAPTARNTSDFRKH